MSKLLNIFMYNGKINKGLLICISLPIVIIAIYIAQFIVSNYQNYLPELIFFSKPFIISFAAVVLFTPIMIFIAKQIKILDYPSFRKVHKNPTPLLGGVGIYLAFLLTAIFFQPWSQQLTSIIIGGGILLIVGTIDDIYPLSSTIRLLAQLGASLIVMSSGLIISFFPETWWGYLVGSIITIIWILGITNAFNFSDGIDGLASGIAFIASMFFFLITLEANQNMVSLVCVILTGSTLGFLIFNFKPAKIYLGDGGSTFLGFILASVALYGGWSERGLTIALCIPALILGVLIFDMYYTTISRIKNGLISNVKEWLDFAGKDHFHHRLIHLGFKEEYAVIFIYLICIILGLSALVLSNVKTDFPAIVLIIQAGLIFTNVTMLMLVGRKLYIPKKVAQKVLLPNNSSLENVKKAFISGDTLKKMLDEERQLYDEKESTKGKN